MINNVVDDSKVINQSIKLSVYNCLSSRNFLMNRINFTIYNERNRLRMCDETKPHRIWNKYLKGSLGIAGIAEKMRE